MGLPQPGQRVRGSQSGRPIMALLDLLGQRWILRILWELREMPLTFRQLQSRCDAMSPTVLNQRLHELRDTKIVLLSAAGYALSEPGKELLAALGPLQRWAENWEKTLTVENSTDLSKNAER